MMRPELIGRGKTRDYIDPRTDVTYHGATWEEAYVRHISRGRWEWWVGVAIEPCAGGLGVATSDDAVASGEETNRGAAVKAAGRAFHELLVD